MALSVREQHIQIAKSLPPLLLNFFKRHPPLPLQQANAATASAPQTTVASNTSSADPNADSGEAVFTSSTSNEHLNPFQSWKNPTTGRWRAPVYSLRQQAVLVKMAQQHGVEELLPHSIKQSGERIRRREENGLRVKGTGIGQKVKGKAWERTLKGRLEERRQAMLGMPKLIREWKEVSLRVVLKEEYG